MRIGPLSPDENPLFSKPESIPVMYWERLREERYSLKFLGFDCKVDKIDKTITVKDFPIRLNFQIYLVILSYLAAPRKELNNGWALAKELKGGIHFFDQSHPLTVDKVIDIYKDNPERLRDAFEKLKATPIEFGDIGYEIEVLPGIRLRYIYWEGDEDFSPELTVNFQKGIEEILALDVVWAMVNVVNATLAAMRG